MLKTILCHEKDAKVSFDFLLKPILIILNVPVKGPANNYVATEKRNLHPKLRINQN